MIFVILPPSPPVGVLDHGRQFLFTLTPSGGKGKEPGEREDNDSYQELATELAVRHDAEHDAAAKKNGAAVEKQIKRPGSEDRKALVAVSPLRGLTLHLANLFPYHKKERWR